jgi:hypothetical protein
MAAQHATDDSPVYAVASGRVVAVAGGCPCAAGAERIYSGVAMNQRALDPNDTLNSHGTFVSEVGSPL